MAFFSDTTALVDLVLALVVLEALGLYVLFRWTGRGRSYSALLANLGAGAALVCAVRAALTGGSYGVIAGIMSLSLVAHLADLWLRWRDPAPLR